MSRKSSQYELTAVGYYADWVSVPVAAAIAIFWLYASQWYPDPELAISAAIFGAGTWTLIEYLVHRFAFHQVEPYKHQHGIHHGYPADYIGVSPGVTIAILVALGFALPAALGPSLGIGYFVGLLGGYLAYIILHDRYHHGYSFDWLRRNHEWHHRRPTVNFGVSSPLWDFVFQTYSVPPPGMPRIPR